MVHKIPVSSSYNIVGVIDNLNTSWTVLAALSLSFSLRRETFLISSGLLSLEMYAHAMASLVLLVPVTFYWTLMYREQREFRCCMQKASRNCAVFGVNILTPYRQTTAKIKSIQFFKDKLEVHEILTVYT